MPTDLPTWVLQLKTSVPAWLETLRQPGQPGEPGEPGEPGAAYGRFRFANGGCVYTPFDIISVHLAAGIYSKLRLDETLSSAQKQEWMDLSLSWRDPDTGEVRDPQGVEKGVPDNDDLVCSVSALRRCLNRCCQGVFDCGNNQPVLQQDVKRFVGIDNMREAFDAQPWEMGSWGAGAQCAHYIMAMQQWQQAGHAEFDISINEAVKYLYAKQHPDTGAFGGKNQDASNIIGGILKVYTRLFGTMGMEIQYPQSIIDTAIELLRSGELKGNCPAHNALIVLLMCSHFTDYRQDDIRQEARLSLERDIHPLIKGDGGFCGNTKTSEYCIWGVKMVEAGHDQSEIHSTIIMLQAVQVVAELINAEDELGFAPTGWKRSSVSGLAVSRDGLGPA